MENTGRGAINPEDVGQKVFCKARPMLTIITGFNCNKDETKTVACDVLARWRKLVELHWN